jgi:hypothetical protein
MRRLRSPRLKRVTDGHICLRFLLPICAAEVKLRLTVEMKDIAVATLGGSSAIASILLVFVGFMIMKVEGLPSETPDHVIAKYK